MYPLSREEREEVRKFVKEQLQKEYIQPSKSPQMAPVFFVGKKDSKKRMVQDYCQEYSMKYIYSTSQMSKLSLTLHTFSVTSSVAGLFLT